MRKYMRFVNIYIANILRNLANRCNACPNNRLPQYNEVIENF